MSKASPAWWDCLSLDEMGEVEAAVDRFRKQSQSGSRPRIADFLPTGDARPELVKALLKELTVVEVGLLRKAGGHPTLTAYTDLYPAHADAVVAAFAEAGPPPVEVLPPEGYGEWLPWDDASLPRMVQQGGFGEVRIAARDPSFRRKVVVKTLLRKWVGTEQEGVVTARLRREADLLAALDHPGIPPVYHQGELTQPKGQPFFAMRLVAGRTLAAVLAESRSPSDVPRLVDLVRGVAEAVGHAHRQGVVHRDLKSLNVMVGELGDVQVMDWGSGKQVGQDELPLPAGLDPGDCDPHADTVLYAPRPQAAADETPALTAGDTHGGVPGTPAYMSPEHADGRFAEMTPASDVFSTGSVLCEAFTGQPAYVGATPQHVRFLAARAELADALARLDAVQASGHVDAELVAICKKCLAPDPQDRYPDCGALARELARYQESVQEQLRQNELAQATARTRRRWIGGMLLLVLLVGTPFAMTYRAGELRHSQALTSILDNAEQQLEYTRRSSLTLMLYDRYGLINQRREVAGALSEIEKAVGIYENSGYAVSQEILDRIDRIEDLGRQLSEDVELAGKAETIQNAVLGTFAADNLATTTIGPQPGQVPDRSSPVAAADISAGVAYYEQIFHEYPSFAPQNGSEVVPLNILSSRTPWLWLEIYDGYANFLIRADQRPLRRKLREIAMKVDSDYRRK